MIKIWENDNYILNNQIYKFYRNYIENNTKYVLLSMDAFFLLLNKSIVIYSMDNNNVDSLMLLSIDDDKAYITFLFSINKNQELLEFAENYLKSININSLWVHCFNPIRLPWYAYNNYIHNNYQGVLEGGKMHYFYLENNFLDNSIQDTFIKIFKESENIKPKLSDEILNKHEEKKIKVSFFNENYHIGFDEFLNKLNNDSWAKMLEKNYYNKNRKPLLVATINNRIVGFSGPLSVNNNKGEFGGIGVIEEARRLKLGTLLFYHLNLELEKMGAEYITLYTGRNNPARYIYLNQGYKIVESFATLKKEL